MTSPIAAEFVEIAEVCFNVLTGMRQQARHDALDALRNACASIGAAWSGSNLGYHASVYTVDLKPRSAGFDPEWGLRGHPLARGPRSWTTYDDNVIENEILSRAHNPNMGGLRDELERLRKLFEAQREHTLSAFAATGVSDEFVDRQKQAVLHLKAPSAVQCLAASLRIPTMSRDSKAAAQGNLPAVHQVLVSLPNASKALEEAFETLERICRDCARHFGRAPIEGIKSSSGPTIVIGHGRDAQWLELQILLEKRLGLRVMHFNHESPAGVTTKDRLAGMIDSADFAFLVLTAEDEQADGTYSARDNVVHEVGLFQSALGFERAIVMLEDGCTEFSNIAGLGQIRFPNGRIRASFEDVREVLEREGIIKAA